MLLLDEPASGLDPRARVELRELLRELRSLGKTILVSSHILPELEELCTSVAIIDRGQVLAQGRVSDIERRLRVGAVFRVRVLGDEDSHEAARAWFGTQPDVVTADLLEDGTIELGFHGDDDGSARLLATAVGAGLRIATSRGRRATSRSCSSRSPPRSPSPAAAPRTAHGTHRLDHPVSATTTVQPRRFGAIRDVFGGIPRSPSRSCAAGCAAGARS